jgi:uncharacterized membrane protein YgaE (UPF0421/DUF939 family)
MIEWFARLKRARAGMDLIIGVAIAILIGAAVLVVFGMPNFAR